MTHLLEVDWLSVWVVFVPAKTGFICESENKLDFFIVLSMYVLSGWTHTDLTLLLQRYFLLAESQLSLVLILRENCPDLLGKVSSSTQSLATWSETKSLSTIFLMISLELAIINGHHLLCDAHILMEQHRGTTDVFLFYSLSSFSAFSFCVFVILTVLCVCQMDSHMRVINEWS